VPYTLNNRVRIYWEEEGQGEPLLMIMGLGFPLAMWGDLRPFMARCFRTIVYDNRGVGKSDAPLPPYSIAKMAQERHLCPGRGWGRARPHPRTLHGWDDRPRGRALSSSPRSQADIGMHQLWRSTFCARRA
jgi:pimeloyl-ACP methyl ester carboxylesterase